jgi:hypothetical protein
MVRVIDTQQQQALESDNLVKTRMILFSLPSGNHGFWYGTGEITYNSIIFKGTGRLIEISDSPETLGLGANGKVIRLNENPAIGLTPTVLATIHQEQYLLRPVVIWDALFNNATGERVGLPILNWSGRIRNVSTKQSGSESYIEAQCESRNYDNSRRNFTMANSAHHDLIAPGDKFFDYCGPVATVAVYFGAPTPSEWTFQNNRAQQ